MNQEEAIKRMDDFQNALLDLAHVKNILEDQFGDNFCIGEVFGRIHLNTELFKELLKDEKWGMEQVGNQIHVKASALGLDFVAVFVN